MSTIYAVASLIEFTNDPAKSSWEDVKRVFDRAGIELTRLPHLSWHVAIKYDLEHLEGYLRQQAARYEPVNIHVAGIGVFSGDNPVIYLPVTKTPQVAQMHQNLWAGLIKYSTAVNEHYDPKIWIPHITLTSADSCGDAICEVISELAYVHLYLNVIADNLSIIYQDDSVGGVHQTYYFSKGSR